MVHEIREKAQEIRNKYQRKSFISYNIFCCLFHIIELGITIVSYSAFFFLLFLHFNIETDSTFTLGRYNMYLELLNE